MTRRPRKSQARETTPEVSIAWSSRSRRPRGYSPALVRAVVGSAFLQGGDPRPISVVFVDDAELAEMHGEWLDDPRATDVITFDLGGGGGPEGELYVSVERAREVASRRGADPLRELMLYVAHGVLHLCGYDDHDPADRRRMRAAERRALSVLSSRDRARKTSR